MNYLGTLFSALLAFHLVTKAIFNLFAEIKIPLDYWTIVDFLCSLFNIVCFNVIGDTTPETIISTKSKMILDYYLLAVLIVGWVRFFSYFLVVKRVAK